MHFFFLPFGCKMYIFCASCEEREINLFVLFSFLSEPCGVCGGGKDRTDPAWSEQQPQLFPSDPGSGVPAVLCHPEGQVRRCLCPLSLSVVSLQCWTQRSRLAGMASTGNAPELRHGLMRGFYKGVEKGMKWGYTAPGGRSGTGTCESHLGESPGWG